MRWYWYTYFVWQTNIVFFNFHQNYFLVMLYNLLIVRWLPVSRWIRYRLNFKVMFSLNQVQVLFFSQYEAIGSLYHKRPSLTPNNSLPKITFKKYFPTENNYPIAIHSFDMSIIQKFLTNQIADDEIIIVMMPSCPTYTENLLLLNISFEI